MNTCRGCKHFKSGIAGFRCILPESIHDLEVVTPNNFPLRCKFYARSNYGTYHAPFVRFDWDYAKLGWKTLYGATKNTLAILAFFFVLMACIPTYIPGTSNYSMETRQDDMQKRLDRLDNVPQDIAVINNKIESMQVEVRASREWQTSITDKLNYYLIAFILLMAKHALEAAGIKFGVERRRKDAE